MEWWVDWELRLHLPSISTPLQSVLLPGKSHGRRRSLVGCRPWGREESDMTERLHFHFSLSCIGEGNGNPLQCSCLENPRDKGTWWAAFYGVAQRWTRLKRLSSSSSSNFTVEKTNRHYLTRAIKVLITSDGTNPTKGSRYDALRRVTSVLANKCKT